VGAGSSAGSSLESGSAGGFPIGGSSTGTSLAGVSSAGGSSAGAPSVGANSSGLHRLKLLLSVAHLRGHLAYLLHWEVHLQRTLLEVLRRRAPLVALEALPPAAGHSLPVRSQP
jgi:hypothetical protein